MNVVPILLWLQEQLSPSSAPVFCWEWFPLLLPREVQSCDRGWAQGWLWGHSSRDELPSSWQTGQW